MTDSYFYNNYGVDLYGKYNIYKQKNKLGNGIGGSKIIPIDDELSLNVNDGIDDIQLDYINEFDNEQKRDYDDDREILNLENINNRLNNDLDETDENHRKSLVYIKNLKKQAGDFERTQIIPLLKELNKYSHPEYSKPEMYDKYKKLREVYLDMDKKRLTYENDELEGYNMYRKRLLDNIKDNNNKIYGYYGGYKNYKKAMRRSMKGGMVEANIDTGKLQSYLFDVYKTDNWDELFDKIKNDDGLTDNQKKNILLNELGDTVFYNYDEDSNKKIKSQSKELFKDIANYLINDLSTSDEDIEKIKTKAKSKAKDNNYENPYFNKMDELANNDPETRGDMTEDNLGTNQPANLSLLDRDNSEVKNTKDLDAFNPNFIKVLRKDFNLTDDEIKKKVLKYFPVDIIKGKTIWEIKSYGDKNKSSNDFQLTKLNGFEGDVSKNGTLKPFEYIFNYTDDGKKVKNITFKHSGGKTINTLNKNDDGYDYYWYLSNKSGTRYFSPLKDEKYKEDAIKKIDNKNIDINDFKKLSPFEINRKLYDDYNIVNKSDNEKITEYINNLLKNKPIHTYIPINKKSYPGQYPKWVFEVDKKISNKLPPSYNEIQYNQKQKNKQLKKNESIKKIRKNKNYYE